MFDKLKIDSILLYLESIPHDLLKPIKLKDGAIILDKCMLGIFYNDKSIGTLIITPFVNRLHVEVRIYSIKRMPYVSCIEIEKRLKNYFNILGLSSKIYCINYYGVLT